VQIEPAAPGQTGVLFRSLAQAGLWRIVSGSVFLSARGEDNSGGLGGGLHFQGFRGNDTTLGLVVAVARFFAGKWVSAVGRLAGRAVACAFVAGPDGIASGTRFRWIVPNLGAFEAGFSESILSDSGVSGTFSTTLFPKLNPSAFSSFPLISTNNRR
jgi:hypothetical protein